MNIEARRGSQRLSIGIKVFTVAAFILILMCVTTLLTVIMARRVNEQMRLLTDDYQKAYASLAVANIRSLDRALTIRRLYISARDGDPDVDVGELKSLAAEDDAAGAKELSHTRDMVRADLMAGGGADPIILSRIDTLLEVAEEQRAKLSAAQTKLIESLATNPEPRALHYLLRQSDPEREAYEQRLNSTRTELYRAGLWDEAFAAFTECTKLRPDDGPSRVFLHRVQELRVRAPEDEWNGVWALTEK